MSANREPLPNLIEPRWWTGEQRELGVLIGAPFNRVGDLDGKW